MYVQGAILKYNFIVKHYQIHKSSRSLGFFKFQLMNCDTVGDKKISDNEKRTKVSSSFKNTEIHCTVAL